MNWKVLITAFLGIAMMLGACVDKKAEDSADPADVVEPTEVEPADDTEAEPTDGEDTESEPDVDEESANTDLEEPSCWLEGSEFVQHAQLYVMEPMHFNVTTKGGLSAN